MPPIDIDEFLRSYEFYCVRDEYRDEPGDQSPIKVDYKLQNPCGLHNSVCDGAIFTMINNTLPLDAVNRIVGSFLFRRLTPESIREMDRDRLADFDVSAEALKQRVQELLQDGLHTYAHVEMFSENAQTLPDNAPYVIRNAYSNAVTSGVPSEARSDLIRGFIFPVPCYISTHGKQTGYFDPFAIESHCNRLSYLGVRKAIVCPLLPI